MAASISSSPDEWVAIKVSPFENEPIKTKFRFLVEWNEAIRQVIITCHEESQKGTKRLNQNVQFQNPKSTLQSNKPTKKGNSNNVSDKNSWTGTFSLQELEYKHEQLCLVRPLLRDHTLELPFDPRGIWSLFFSVTLPPNFTSDLERYLYIALEICGKTLLIDTLYQPKMGIDQYLESFSELKQKAFEDDLEKCEKRLKDCLRKHNNAANMVALKKIFLEEEEAFSLLVVARAELFNLLLQPFLDMREMAYCELLKLQDFLQDEHISSEGRKKSTIAYSDWQMSYVNAIESILQVKLKYFNQCLDTTKG